MTWISWVQRHLGEEPLSNLPSSCHLWTHEFVLWIHIDYFTLVDTNDFTLKPVHTGKAVLCLCQLNLKVIAVKCMCVNHTLWHISLSHTQTHKQVTYGGLSHFLCLNWTPVPQVLLHMLHWLQGLQSPSTCWGMGVLLTHSPALHHWHTCRDYSDF